MKVKFIYAHGTSWMINWVEVGLRVSQDLKIYIGDQQPTSQGSATVAGLNGVTAQWDAMPQNDPFAMLLDPDKWEVERIQYPASMIPMSTSMTNGIDQVVDIISNLPAGQPFALGGYSQGAAVMSTVYNEIRYGSLTSRQSTFLGGVMFGNPRRQQDYRGPVGGTWSGLWYNEAASTGGRGSFPATGQFARLSSCEATKWVEFAYPGDVFTCNGASTLGDNWSAGNDAITDMSASEIIAYLSNLGPILDAVGAAFAKGEESLEKYDATGQPIILGGSGHTAYPLLPPYNVATTDTCYQVALKFLEGLADEYATAPILQPSSTAGWSTTLLPPAA